MSDPPSSLRRPNGPLTDGMVTLDRFTRADVLDVVRAIDDEIVRWVPVPDPYGESEARGFIGDAAATAETGQTLHFAVRYQGRLAGSISVAADRPVAGEAEIGYWVAPHARNRGIARRAVRLLAEHVFTSYAPRRIELLMHPDNAASRRTAEAAGATYEGIRPDALSPPAKDGTTDAAVYTLVPVAPPARLRDARQE